MAGSFCIYNQESEQSGERLGAVRTSCGAEYKRDPQKWLSHTAYNMPRIRSLLLYVNNFVGDFGWGRKGIFFKNRATS